MKPGSTLFLKIVVYALGLAVLAIGVALGWGTFGSEEPAVFLPVLIGMYFAAVPFYIALHQTLKLLQLVEISEAFSQSSVKALSNIRYCAISIAVLYGFIMPFMVLLADADDAPGFSVLGMVIILASVAVGTFAAVLQKLLHDALVMKDEHDWTV